MEPVLKTGDGETHREFESHTLRQDKLTGFDKKLVNFFIYRYAMWFCVDIIKSWWYLDKEIGVPP